MLFLLLCLILLLGACCAGAAWDGRMRVYQGTEDLLNEFPFIVALDFNLIFQICTGSLISDAWVITAAHCICGFPTDLITARYADFTVRPKKTKAYVKTVRFILHPSFRDHGNLMRNDIGLIHTNKVPTNSFAKLSAVDYKALLGLPAKYAGFGYTSKKFQGTDGYFKNDIKPLQVGEGVVTTCPETGMSGWMPAICLAPKCSVKKQQPFHGDSGGPLLCNGKLVAVISGTRPDSEPITDFTPVSSNLHWILDLTLNKSSPGLESLQLHSAG